VVLKSGTNPQTGAYGHRVSEIEVAAPFLLLERSAADLSTALLAVTEQHAIGVPKWNHLHVVRRGDEMTDGGSTPAVGQVEEIDVEGDIGAVANERGGMSILDLSDPSRPVTLSTLEIEDRIVDKVRIRNPHAFLLTNAGLATVLIDPPSHPRLLSVHEFDDLCCQLELQGNLAIVGTEDACAMTLIDISDPEHPIRITDFEYCNPDHGSYPILSLRIFDDRVIAYRHRHLMLIDIGDPLVPVMLMDHFDLDLRGILAERDHLFATYYHGEVRLCQITDDFRLVVGRVYDEFSASNLSSPGPHLIHTNHPESMLIDVADLAEPVPHAVPPIIGGPSGGRVVGDVLIRPNLFELDLVSLECRPPEAAFRSTGVDLNRYFEDTSRYRVEERWWDFGDGTTSTESAPVHRYAAPGRYRVTLTVQNDLGSDSVTGTVVVRDSAASDEPDAVHLQ
jgi:hypothetical protein